MPAASISNVVTGVLKDANLGAEERVVVAKIFRKVASAIVEAVDNFEKEDEMK